jgi:exopolysaccharide production protein ExoQ
VIVDPAPRPALSNERAWFAARKILAKVEAVAVVITLLLLALNRLPGFTRGPDDSDPFMQSFFRVVYLLGAVGVAVRWRAVGRAIRSHPWTVVIPLLAAGSWWWSILPDETVRRTISLAGTTFVGLYLGTRFELQRLITLLAWSLAIAAVLSVLIAVAWPAIGLAEGKYAGAWRGAFTHKNVMGRAMVLGLGTFLYLVWGYRHRWLTGTLLGLVAALVVLSTSKTAAVIAAALILAVPLYSSLRSRHVGARFAAAATLALAITIGALVSSNPEEAFDALGRDATMTGRTGIWQAVLEEMRERPVAGHGYGAFWNDRSEPAANIYSALRWETPHAHNGLLDLGLELGIIGMLVVVVSIISLAARTVRALAGDHRKEAVWVALFLTFIFLYNVTESTLVRYGTLFWVLYVAVGAATAAWRRSEPTMTGTPGWREGLSPGIRWRLNTGASVAVRRPGS